MTARTLVLLTFIDNVKKKTKSQNILIRIDEIWQHSSQYRTSLIESMKIKVEQRILVTKTAKNQISYDSYFVENLKNCLIQFG